MEGSRFAVKVLSPEEFRWITQNSAKMAKFKKAGAQRLFTLETLLQDIFYTLYQQFSVFFSTQNLRPAGRFNKLLIQQLLKSADFKRAKAYSTGNMPGSGMFTLYFAEKILQHLDGRIAETVNEMGMTEEEFAFAEINYKAACKVAQFARKAGFDPVAETFELEAEQWKVEAETKERQLSSLSARLSQLWHQSGKARFSLGEQNPSGRGKAIFETGTAGSRAGTGIWARGPLGQQLKLAGEYLGSSKLERIAARLAQLKDGSRAAGKATEKDILEIRGINYGSDISYVLPEELMDFFLPGRRLYFFRRLSEESFGVYNLRHTRKKAKTALVLCLDNSGSMQGAKEITCKALAVALMEIASRQKRDITVIMFGGPEDVMKVFEFPKGRLTLDQITEIGEYFLCSPGTDFEKPLKEAVRIFEKRSHPSGDIVFITDGVCKVGTEFLDAFRASARKRNIKTTSVMVGYGKISGAYLEEFSDVLFHSRDLLAGDVAGELFGMLGGE